MGQKLKSKIQNRYNRQKNLLRQVYVNDQRTDDDNLYFLFLDSISGRFGRVIITSKDNDENILRSEVWKELRLLDDIIQNTTVEYDGDIFSYREICARWEGECFTNDILNLDYILPEVSNDT
jgi:hypothetical protein